MTWINMGAVDRVLRLVLGVALLAFAIWAEVDWRWVGWIGLVPLATAAIGWCPLYAMLGIGTNGKDGESGPPAQGRRSF